MVHGALQAWKMSVFCLWSLVDAVMVVTLFCLFFSKSRCVLVLFIGNGRLHK